jgi:thiol:disulfide interchange protein/DsbC/DsbD-like thiol-disulfide interchange protein
VRVRIILFAAICFAVARLSAHAAHTQARLLLAAETAQPGATVLAGVHLHMDKGWHTYWRNSGGSGMPTTIDWELPAGVTAGTIQWPVPKKMPEQELTTYIYEDDVILLVPLTLVPGLPSGPLDLKAKVSWLECEVKCVPGDAKLQTRLNVGTENKPSTNVAFLESWKTKLPGSGDGLAAQARWESGPKGDLRPLLIEWNSKGSVTEPDFFPDSNEKFEVQPLTERLKSPQGKIRVRAHVKLLAGDWPKEVSGLLIEQSGSKHIAYDVKLPVGGSGLLGPATASAGTASAPSSSTPSLWKMFLYAFIGGLILNVMPCVLPVIALKILGFVSEARNELGRVRKLGLIYTAGVLSSFFVLALLVLGLQTAGKGAGWGFQFGNPYFLLAMTTLVTLIALNLFGVFEITLGSGALTAATNLASKHGAAGAFFNGLLATVLATSCSAPFLGAAIGFAFALSRPVITMFILLTVGLGLASPYLVLSWQPAWLRVLPKPGPWMERFKVAMGFPMIAAAAWLCSLVAVHYGDRAWWMVMFLVFVAVAAWVYGEFVQRGTKRRGLAIFLSVLLLAIGYSYALDSKLDWREPIKETAGRTEPSKVAPKGLAWQPWSAEAVAEARAAGRPVVVDFTAKWCPTCNTIIKPSFENTDVQKKLKEVNAAALLADYTRFPDSITAELKRFQRAAVPLVLVYPRNLNEPPMVFDLVRPGTILDALSRAAQ